MRHYILIALLALCCAVPAYAATDDAADVPKKNEVPFREDSGLITAEYYLATGKYAQALDTVKNVLDRHPECADAYTYRGYAFEMLGDVKKAMENYKQAITLNPTHLGANTYLGKLYLKEGDLDRALDQLRVVRMICGGTLCEEVDDLEAAVNRFRRAGADAPPAMGSRRLTPDNRLYYQR